ncbi:MAG TPA: DUF5625 family protein [Terriglobales bacterium]|nr:DUF5625 family protein [Terriglobales bacterium]
MAASVRYKGFFTQLIAALLALPTPLAVGAAERSERALAPPFTAPWDIRRSGTSVSRVFTLSRTRYVWFEIEFYRTDGQRDILTNPEFRNVVGDGSTVFVTEASADTDDPVIVEDYIPGQYRPPGQGVRARVAHSGVMVPMRLVVQDLDNPAQPPKLNQVFKTWSFAHGTEKGLSRTMGWVELPPVRYRVTATTVQDTTLLANLETRFDVTYPPKK